MAWADRNPTDQVIIGYCAPRGIRLSEFLEVWSDSDRAAVYDWLEEQANRCGECGGDLRETMLKENTFAYKATGLQCHRCRGIHKETIRLRGGGKENPLAGIAHYRITRRDEQETQDGRVDDPGRADSEAEPAGGRDP